MKFYPIAVIAATLLCISTSSFSQTILLVNGQPTEVVLQNDDIKAMVNTSVESYLNSFEQKSDNTFQKFSYDEIVRPETIVKLTPRIRREGTLPTETTVVALREE